VKATEWTTLSGPLAAALPDFEQVKKGFIQRHEWVAACFYADSSSYSGSAFYLEAFALPLFVPSDHLYFNYGGRVGAKWEDVTDDLLRAVEASLPRLNQLATLDGLLGCAVRPHVDLHHTEVHFCVALIRGDVESFHRLGDEIGTWNEEQTWERPIIDRCATLAETVRVAGPEVGIGTLRQRAPGVLALFA
jgi:hypothetical protein